MSNGQSTGDSSRVSLRDYLIAELEAATELSEEKWSGHSEAHKLIAVALAQGDTVLNSRLAAMNEWRATVTDLTGDLPNRFASLESMKAIGQKVADLEAARIREAGAVEERQRALATTVDERQRANEKGQRTTERYMWMIGLGVAVFAAILKFLPTQ